MEKLEKLSTAQENKLAEYVEKWISIGLSCEEISQEKAARALDKAYSCAGLKPPKDKYFFRSPHAGARIAASLELKKEEKNVTKEEIQAQVNNAGYGSHDAGWLSFYDFFINETQVTNLSPIAGLIEVGKTCGWYWPFENAVVICDRPKTIKMDDQKRLHCETGPAIEYRDGAKGYIWHGTRVPENWIIDKKSLTPQTALKWENVEQRRCACEILGWDNILSILKAKTIDKNKDAQVGELVEINTPELGKEKFLRVKCGTGRIFSIPVPPDMETALQANAWTYNLNANDYKPEVRT
jgi:hypothetical protein